MARSYVFIASLAPRAPRKASGERPALDEPKLQILRPQILIQQSSS